MAQARPGFAEADAQGAISGRALDLCRAAAVAVVGPTARIHLKVIDAEYGQEGLAGAFDIVFAPTEDLPPQASVKAKAVLFDPIALMVPDRSSAHVSSDLAGQSVCLIIGTPAQRALEATLGRTKPAIVRMSFREDVEMLDAYNVGRCDAAVDETSRLDEMREQGGINRVRSRVLAPPLAITEVIAATPAGDDAWNAAVAAALP